MNLAASLQGLPNLATHPQLRRELERASKYLPSAITAILVIAIAWQLAKMTWLLFPAAPEVIMNAPPAQISRANGTLNAQKIADAHLFGVATVGDSADVNNAPQTQMALVLTGVLAAPDPKQGFAFIGESAANAKFHRVTDPLGGGATLYSVYVDRVMLDRGGRLESLLLPRLSASTTPLITSAPPPQPMRFAENIRHIAETNPGAFSQIVRAQPVFDGAKLEGYRVYPGRNRQEFIKLGLRPGDLVTAVSGTPLTDQSSAMQIFNTISTTDQVALTVQRDGQIQQLNVNTSQIDLPDPNAATGATPSPPPPHPSEIQNSEPRPARGAALTPQAQ